MKNNVAYWYARITKTHTAATKRSLMKSIPCGTSNSKDVFHAIHSH